MKIHIAIGQYEFVEEEFGVDEAGINASVDFANAIKTAFSVGGGIPDKDFNAIIDAMLRGEAIKNGSELWPQLSEQQQFACQSIKRSKARTTRTANKQEKTTTNHLKDLE